MTLLENVKLVAVETKHLRLKLNWYSPIGASVLQTGFGWFGSYLSSQLSWVVYDASKLAKLRR